MGGRNSETLLQRAVKSKSGSGGGGGASWREAFRILTTLLLTLLIPLSFLLLARLSTARYLAAAQLVSDYNSTSTSSQPLLISFLFLYSNISTILNALVTLVTVAAFVHGLTGRLTTILNISQSPVPGPISDRVYRPRLYAALIILCTLQVCVGLGIEGTIHAGIDGSRRFVSSSRNFLGEERIISWLSRIIFFVGLHDTMHFWSKSVVKPVVDDTVMGFVVKEERWIERVGMALSFGTFWWWKLRDEVDSLVVVAELKRDLQPLLVGFQPQGVGPSSTIALADFVGWWLYYLTVTIGTIRLLKGGIWLGMILLFRRVDRNLCHDSVSDRPMDDQV